MSKKELQKSIRENEGFIFSEGTLNLNHLLSKAYDLIVAFNLKGNPNSHIQTKTIRHDIKECFTMEDKLIGDESLFNKVFYSEAEISREKDSDSHYVWEDVTNYFMSLAPKGYYFGSSEGDGALIGWFSFNENEY